MTKVVWLVIAFLVIGGYMIKTAYDYDFEEKDDQRNFFVKFVKWVMQLGGNIKDLTGHAVQQEWLPDTNETNSTER